MSFLVAFCPLRSAPLSWSLSAATWCTASSRPSRSRSARARLQDQPAPVLAARATVADVPIYLDAVGNTRALNTVTVRAAGRRADRQGGLQGRPGRAERASCSPRSIRAPIRRNTTRPSPRRRRTRRRSPMRALDLERYTRLAAIELRLEAAGRHAEGAGRAARSAGAGRSGGDRQRADHAELHQDRRRRSTAAPACAWSTRAIWCRRTTPTAS